MSTSVGIIYRALGTRERYECRWEIEFKGLGADVCVLSAGEGAVCVDVGILRYRSTRMAEVVQGWSGR